VHVPIAAEALHVVAGHEPAHRVADDVHPLVAGLLADLLDQRAQPGGHVGDVVGERRVVERVGAPEAATAQCPAQKGEDAAVVDDPVDQDDRRPGRLDVADDEPALHW
jgi:hypothetical protein